MWLGCCGTGVWVLRNTSEGQTLAKQTGLIIGAGDRVTLPGVQSVSLTPSRVRVARLYLVPDLCVDREHTDCGLAPVEEHSVLSL